MYWGKYVHSTLKEEAVMSFCCIRAAFGVSYTSALAVFKPRFEKALRSVVSGAVSVPVAGAALGKIIFNPVHPHLMLP